MKIRFEEVKKDYNELISKWGHPCDMTGGFVDAEHMEKVILNPTKSNARDYLVSVIDYGFQDMEHYRSEMHGNIKINECEILQRLFEKYK